MNDGECSEGMRVVWNDRARRRPGIAVGLDGKSRSAIAGRVVSVGKNEYGTDLAHIRWDDGRYSFASVDWLNREPGIRHDAPDPLGR